ncbi:hypothetical protein ACUODJ_60050, partial [Escherichia sp. HC-CC]
RIVRIDPHAEEFLSNEQVERQLKSAMERWIINVLSAQVDDVERLIQIQHTVALFNCRSTCSLLKNSSACGSMRTIR